MNSKVFYSMVAFTLAFMLSLIGIWSIRREYIPQGGLHNRSRCSALQQQSKSYTQPSLSSSDLPIWQNLALYQFEKDDLHSNPAKLYTDQQTESSVKQTVAFKAEGNYGLEIQDAAGEGSFPELQGYFPLQQAGSFYTSFYLMITDPHQALNIALAGPERFTVQKDGIGVWLSVKEGFLYQHSNRVEKKIFAPHRFTWYLLTIRYDVSDGSYDLFIKEKGQQTSSVSLLAQPNASGEKGFTIDKFSFIGDLEDQANTVYYLDDISVYKFN